MSVLNDKHFHDEAAAMARLEAILWPDGPVCPHCGNVDKVYEIKGKTARPGLRTCGACRKQFTVKIGTLFEDSHVPMHKWWQAVHLLCSSKKGISSHQLHRTLRVTYKTAWFISHRIREAMRVGKPYKEMGSIEGYFQSVGRDGRGRRTLLIKSRLTGDEVKCFVTGDAEKELAHREIEDVWRGRRVSVFGTIHYRGVGRISQVDASKIRFLRSKSELPDIDDIIDPDFTGGLRSEDYLEKLRDGELS